MTDLPGSLGPALRDRYRLDREIGHGGMAVVWLAQDLRHKRPVAFKVLHPELAASLGVERFQREIETAARLQHPHILGVYDSGEVPAAEGRPGWLWFTMPYVEGESLRDRLAREHQLPVNEAVRITREILAALAYAHAHQVIHRDIKPENILLTEEGHVLVADFGIARSLRPDEAGLTQTGMAVGTPAYMSPEQAMGEQLDARSDIYSTGCVLYEMLVGEPPHTGPSAQAIAARRLTEPVRPVRATRDAVAEGLDAVALKSLARSRADRFATAAEFARALGGAVITPTATPTTPVPTAVRPVRRRMWAAGGVALVALSAATLVARRGDSPAAVDANTIAVAPFDVLATLCPECAAERLLKARLLAAHGRDREALDLLDQGLIQDLFLVPWLLERARIEERLGMRDRAVEDYGKVARFWRNPDPELVPIRDEARAALARLTAEPSS